jgi:hypothetical protein
MAEGTRHPSSETTKLSPGARGSQASADPADGSCVAAIRHDQTQSCAGVQLDDMGRAPLRCSIHKAYAIAGRGTAGPSTPIAATNCSAPTASSCDHLADELCHQGTRQDHGQARGLHQFLAMRFDEADAVEQQCFGALAAKLHKQQS